MTPDMYITLGILILAITSFVTEKLRVDIVAFLVVVALMLTGILDTSEALSGFSNPAVLTVAALFIVGGAVFQSGLAAAIGTRILAIAGKQESRLIAVLMVAVALLSSLMSDTGTVAVLLPAVVILSHDAKISPSRLLIPLSYGALLGGAMTLIGTTPNIIVSDLLSESGMEPFSFFSFTPIGVAMLIVGVAFMVLVGRRLLPTRETRQDEPPVQTPDELIDHYRLPDNLYGLRVRRTSLLTGRPLDQTPLRSEYHLTVLEIQRASYGRRIFAFGDSNGAGHSNTVEALQPTPETILRTDDLLLVQGTSRDIARATAALNLAVQPANSSSDSYLISKEAGIAEIIIPPRSKLIGRSIADCRFGTTYKLTVLALQRPGESGSLAIATTPLEFGDTLLVQGAWEDILALKPQRRDFIVTGQPESMLVSQNRKKAILTAVVLVGMMLLMATNLLSVTAASMLAALTIVLSGVLTMDEAYQSIDWRSILLIAGMLPMSIALQKVHLVDMVAVSISDGLGTLGPHAVMAGLFLLTSLCTQVLSNTATTVLVSPIAMATALALHVQPQAFMMAVGIAASMAFASPVASPVNTLVMGAGNYRFSDFMKAGIPMIVIMLAICLAILPLLFPF